MRLAALALLCACNGSDDAVAPTDDADTGTVDSRDRDPRPGGGSDRRRRGVRATVPVLPRGDGLGTGKGPDLTVRLVDLEQADVVNLLLEGKGNMDSYASQSDQDLANVSAYVLDAFKP